MTVGRFLSFVANDWEIGLGCLAEGNDDDLRDLATLSMNHEAEPLDRVRLADRWMRFSEKLDEPEQQVIQQQCRIWYQQAYAELSGGSEASRIKRILDSAPQAGSELKIKLELDGYGELTISPEEISWTTQSGEEPARIDVNGLEWDPRQSADLRNRGSTRFLDDNVSLKSPRAKTTSGRAFTRIVETSPDKLVIRLSDVPTGSATSEILVEFGK
ncbi:MAG: hypothetical protein KDA69_06515 [Planctomycetaceae bacterium]|nr:hypothetical protein [Planctomycetaceae bacterium]MCA9043953.1 hypothetical protein [Planctomycetaceae bacterium]